jgi:hypothetical protein
MNEMNMVIDRETYAKVLAAEPTVAMAPDVLGKLVVRALENETLNPLYAAVVSAESGVFSMLVKDLALRMGREEVTPARVGRVVTQLGLRSVRTRLGFRVFWNRSQLVLLKNALGV